MTRSGPGRLGVIEKDKRGLMFGRAAAHRAAVRPSNGARVCDPQRVRQAGRDRVGLKRPDVRTCCGSQSRGPNAPSAFHAGYEMFRLAHETVTEIENAVRLQHPDVEPCYWIEPGPLG